MCGLVGLFPLRVGLQVPVRGCMTLFGFMYFVNMVLNIHRNHKAY